MKREQIAKRLGKKRVIIAISWAIITAIYQMMSTEEAWNPIDLFKIDTPEALKENNFKGQLIRPPNPLKSKD